MRDSTSKGANGTSYSGGSGGGAADIGVSNGAINGGTGGIGKININDWPCRRWGRKSSTEMERILVLMEVEDYVYWWQIKLILYGHLDSRGSSGGSATAVPKTEYGQNWSAGGAGSRRRQYKCIFLFK